MRKNSYLSLKYLIPLIISILVAVFLCFFKIIIINGQSMEPTLKSGQPTLAINNNSNLEVNDIIIFHSSNLGVCVKRVVACEGDEVKMDCGKLFINGAEQYHYDCQRTQEKTIVLHEEEYFVLGDNANASVDSREMGVIMKDMVIGKLIVY